MAQNFISPGSRTLDDIVRKSTTQDEDITVAFERMKAELHEAGCGGIVTEPIANELLYGRTAQDAQAAAAPDPSVPRNFSRVIYPFANNRFELFGTSEEDLNLQEARIRALYQ